MVMLYDTFQEKSRQLIELTKVSSKEAAAIAHIQLEQLKVDYYSGLLGDQTHPIKKLNNFIEDQLTNSLWLLGKARDEYFELTGKEYIA